MAPKDDSGLAWHGRPAQKRSGGFVDGVGLNERTNQLAFDPDGVVGPEAARSTGRSGPTLDVERLDEGDGRRIQPNGRVRLP